MLLSLVYIALVITDSAEKLFNKQSLHKHKGDFSQIGHEGWINLLCGNVLKTSADILHIYDCSNVGSNYWICGNLLTLFGKFAT